MNVRRNSNFIEEVKAKKRKLENPGSKEVGNAIETTGELATAKTIYNAPVSETHGNLKTKEGIIDSSSLSISKLKILKNRESASKSRNKKKAQFNSMKKKILSLEEEIDNYEEQANIFENFIQNLNQDMIMVQKDYNTRIMENLYLKTNLLIYQKELQSYIKKDEGKTMKVDLKIQGD